MGSFSRAVLIAPGTPEVTACVVGTLHKHSSSFPFRITVSVFVPPTSTPLQRNIL